MANGDWPEGLTDEDAITRLQSIMIAACEGARDLSFDREYRALRSTLIKRGDLADVVPKYIRAHRDLTSFWSYIRKYSDKWKPRREHIWETFKPLHERVEGRTRPPALSAGWTGRRTSAQQARIVLTLAPDAIHGVELLLDEQERPLHNGGPIDPEQQNAIAALRELHEALGELIELASHGKPLNQKLTKVRGIKDSIFRWSSETYGLAVSGTPLTAAATVLGCGVMYLVNVITKDVEAAATIGAATVGAHVISAKLRK